MRPDPRKFVRVYPCDGAPFGRAPEPPIGMLPSAEAGVGPVNFPGSRKAACLCGSGKAWKRCCGAREG